MHLLRRGIALVVARGGKESVLCLLALALAGCKEADLKGNQWSSLHVDYCVGAGPVVEKRQWHTSDPTLLDRLRRAYVEQEREPSWTASHMTTNRIRVTLANRQQWDLYFFEPTRMRLMDPTDGSPAYSLTVSQEFYQAVKDQIESETGSVIHFFYTYNVKFADDHTRGARKDSAPKQGEHQLDRGLVAATTTVAAPCSSSTSTSWCRRG